MKIELINTGTELLIGEVLNTHGAWLGKRLGRLGLALARQTTVPDGEVIASVLRESMTRADMIVVTGGLGPTHDDMTRALVADILDVPLVESAEARAVVQRFFEKRNRPISPSNWVQALVPNTPEAHVLDNPNGTAPGLFIEGNTERAALYLLPGPPSEFYPLVDKELIPRLEVQLRMENKSIPQQRIYKTVGVGESLLYDRIHEKLSGILGLDIGYCCHPGEVDIRLIGDAIILDKADRILQTELGDCLLDDSGRSLAEHLIAKLQEKEWMVATAESCTGGLIASALTDVSGASSVFGFGWVTYANEAKVRELHVSDELLQQHGAVSEAVARAMAEGALAESGAHIAVAVTGIAGPTGGSDEKPVGTVYIAWALNEQTHCMKYFFPVDRMLFRRYVVQSALTGLWKLLK